MIGGKLLTLCMLVASAVARDLSGVDPNTLSCDPYGMESLHLPHYTDCDKFYMCAHGLEVEMQCTPGTIFDFPIQVCNWPWATKCYLRKDDFEGSGEEEFDFHSGKVATKPVAIESLMTGHMNCNQAESASRRVGYKGDCQRYWSCLNGSPRTFYCADGLFFNEEKQQCDFEANVKCVDDNVDELKTEFIEYK